MSPPSDVPLDRRAFLGSAAALAAGPVAGPGELRLLAVGQALILQDVNRDRYPGYVRVRDRLKRGDVCFTNLEAAIRGAKVKDADVPKNGVAAAPAVLDALKAMSFNLLSLANNHADDCGVEGFLASIAESKKRGFAVAGTGRNLAEAAAPGYLKTPKGTVALVAVASQAVPDWAMATATRPGVAHLALKKGVLEAAAVDRTLASIKAAAKAADWVVAYHHDHYWAPDWQDTPDWKKKWARACIDAGATAFVGHGVPILHGIEVYKKRPIFYGLANFIFHLSHHLDNKLPKRFVETGVWQSVIADCQFRGRELRALRLEPVTLKDEAAVAPAVRLDGNPRFAAGAEAKTILERLRKLSKAVGTRIDVRDGYAEVSL